MVDPSKELVFSEKSKHGIRPITVSMFVTKLAIWTRCVSKTMIKTADISTPFVIQVILNPFAH